ncbi:MAG: RlmE family RNA methyltransferase [Terricaulis sp.]
MSDEEKPPEEKRRWRNKAIITPGGERKLAVRVKKKNTRSESSRRWIERQVNDPYVQRTQAEGWRARSAFKLIELDDKYEIIKRGAHIVDLGAAPGGWAQVALKRGAGRVVGIDLLPIDP